MHNAIKKLIYQTLTEKVYEINQDVDYIYDLYFSSLVSAINSNKTYDELKPLFDDSKGLVISSRSLESSLCKQAHDVNPIIIKSDWGNYYDPDSQKISLSLNESAFEMIQDHGTLSLAKAIIKNNSGSEIAEKFVLEFSEARIKGSIHHELAHWIDDSLYKNKNGVGRIKNVFKYGNKSKRAHDRITQGYSDVGLTDYEIQAQVHSVIQLKRKYQEQWDNMTFDEMVNLSPSLHHLRSIYKKRKEDLLLWKKMLLKRLHRENLLGKKMK